MPEDLVKIWWYISYNEPFIVKIDDGFFRAIRVPASGDFDKELFMEIYLLDTGERFVLRIIDFHFEAIFEMPPTAKSIPALALKCELNHIEVGPFANELEFFKAILYHKFTIEVVSVEEDFLLVDIYPFDETNESLGDSSLDESLENSPQEQVALDKETNEQSSSFSELSADSNQLSPVIKIENFNSMEQFIWLSEPLATDDPLIAVQGFATEDNVGLCKFSDPQIGGCWKKGQCHLRHQNTIKDGSCRDQQEIFHINKYKTLPLPPIHSVVKIKITTVVSTNQFWCTYVNTKASSNKPLDTLVATMNKPEEIKSYQAIKFAPAENQLVVVKASDGKYYRGRVTDGDTDYETELAANVLLVDFGIFEKIFLDSIFNWIHRFGHELEFQAVEMEIANIKPLENNDDEQDAIHLLNKLIAKHQNKFKALIFENIVGIKCRLTCPDFDDIGEHLVDIGLASPRTIQPPLGDLQIIPV